ncbi:MAG: hypothetical protein QM754_14190 [Tepidisphaeraceae bacterium]
MTRKSIAGIAVAAVAGIAAFTLVTKAQEKTPPASAADLDFDTDDRIRLPKQGTLIVENTVMYSTRSDGCFATYGFNVVFNSTGSDKGPTLFRWTAPERTGGFSPTFALKAAKYDGTQAVIVFNSDGKCRAVVTQPTEKVWNIVAPRLTRDGKPVPENDEALALGPAADSATVDPTATPPVVTLKRGHVEQRYVLKTDGDTATWVEAK